MVSIVCTHCCQHLNLVPHPSELHLGLHSRLSLLPTQYCVWRLNSNTKDYCSRKRDMLWCEKKLLIVICSTQKICKCLNGEVKNKCCFFYCREGACRLDEPDIESQMMAIERHIFTFDQGMFYSDGHSFFTMVLTVQGQSSNAQGWTQVQSPEYGKVES